MKVNHVGCGQLHSAVVTGTSILFFSRTYSINIILSDKNQLYTWGWGAGGCLGHGDMRYQLVPRLVTSLQGEDIIGAAAGWKHTLVIKGTPPLPSFSFRMFNTTLLMLIITAGTSSTFAFDFRPAINNPQYSDIAFIVQNKKVHAHKVYFCG